MPKQAKKAKPSILQNKYVMKKMDDLDMYGSSVYSYNFEGRENINSLMGTIVSIVVYIFTLKFLIEQTLVMVHGKNPSVS
jgi:hypothetical protein